MDGELREKLVWRCYRFNPSPKELANSIIVDKLPKNAYELGFDANKCVLSAVESANCMNARAMIKASALISMAFESNAACDSEVDGENREAALRDFVSLALLAAMGRAPKRPAEREPGMPFDYEHARELELFNRYMSLDVIESYFNVMDAVSREAVDICLARYITHRYSGSPDTMSVARVLQRMRDVQGMDDKEVAELATELSDCILHTRFDASYIGEAVRTNWTLRSWGFEESVDSETVRARVQFLADEDPEGTYRGIRREYIAWQEDWADRYDGLMADLDAYVVEVYETRKREENKRLVRCGDPDAGRCLADVVQKGWSHGEDLFVEFAPKTVADCFACGNAASQKVIYAMSMGFESRAVFFHNAEAMEWARSLCEELRAVDPKSRMGRVRRRWTVEAIERLLKIGVAA